MQIEVEMRTRMEDKYGFVERPIVKKYQGQIDLETDQVPEKSKNKYIYVAIIASLCNATG